MNLSRYLLGMFTITGMAYILVVKGAAGQVNYSSRADALQNAAEVKALLKSASHVLVFRGTGRKRQYVGDLPKGSKAFRELCQLVGKAELASADALAQPDYEMAVIGIGLRRFAKYDSQADVIAFFSVKDGKLHGDYTLKLRKPLTGVFKLAKPLSKPKEKFNPKHIVHASWRGLPHNLVEVVKSDASWRTHLAELPPSPLLILTGIPVAVLRNEYEMNAQGRRDDPTHQYCVYLIAVEQYLKDDTRLHLPVLEYNQNGGYLGGGMELSGDPLLELGERYLLFVTPARQPGFVEYGGYRTRRYLEGEFLGVDPFLQTWLVGGETLPRDPHEPLSIYVFGDGKTTLIFKKEQQVIAEILAAIKQAEEQEKR